MYFVRLGETSLTEVGKMNNKKTCGICGAEKEAGIHVYTMFICCECEQEIVHTEPEEQKYHMFIEKLKSMKQLKLYS